VAIGGGVAIGAGVAIGGAQPLIGLARLRPRALGAQAPERVQGRLARLDRGKRGIEQLDRADLPAPESLCLRPQAREAVYGDAFFARGKYAGLIPYPQVWAPCTRQGTLPPATGNCAVLPVCAQLEDVLPPLAMSFCSPGAK